MLGAGCSNWLIKRMENIKNLPPPSLEEIELQINSSNKLRESQGLDLSHKQILRGAVPRPATNFLVILLLILLYFPCVGGNLNDLITLSTNKIDTEIINQFIRNNSFK